MKNKQFTVLGVCLLFLLSGVVTTSATAEDTSCHFTPYTADYASNHYSLIKNNATLVGNFLIIETNCPLTYSFGNGMIFETSSNVSIHMPESTNQLQIIQNNLTHTYSNLVIFASTEVYFGDFVDESLLSQKSNSEVWWGEILSHATTFLILYFLSTTIVYRFAKKRVDDAIEVII